MDDRTLLEMAARAAGIVIDKSPHNGGGHGNTGFDAIGNAVLDWHNGKTWNPLTSDGDALRLAVKLGIDIEHFASSIAAHPNYRPLFHTDAVPANYLDQGERCAAARRAIVRAAAHIGAEIGRTGSGG
jgi:hypothetical protein